MLWMIHYQNTHIHFNRIDTDDIFFSFHWWRRFFIWLIDFKSSEDCRLLWKSGRFFCYKLASGRFWNDFTWGNSRLDVESFFISFGVLFTYLCLHITDCLFALGSMRSVCNGFVIQFLVLYMSLAFYSFVRSSRSCDEITQKIASVFLFFNYLNMYYAHILIFMCPLWLWKEFSIWREQDKMKKAHTNHPTCKTFFEF